MASDKIRRKLIAQSGLEIGNAQSGNYIAISDTGDFKLYGTATQWEDLRIDGLSTRVGAIAPTDETGFRGNSNISMRSFVHTQADEVQFVIQLPHNYKVGSDLYPHVHFSPEIAGSGNNQASFRLEYYAADINTIFPATSSSLLMSASWNGNRQWYHLIAPNNSVISGSGLGISSLIHCRLYRDNTSACNLQGKVSFEYFDVHYEVDSLGSAQEYIK